MPKTCVYHGGFQPCRSCLEKRMGEFAFYKPRSGVCPYHNKPFPCLDCFDKKMGEFAHGVASAIQTHSPVLSVPYVAPIPVKKISPIHFHQSKKDTCAIACCAMVGATLGCPRNFSVEDLEDFMTEKGIYLPGKQSVFHSLDKVFDWLGLKSKMLTNQSLKDIQKIVKEGKLVIIEALGHVIVVFSADNNEKLVIGDPAMSKAETNVPINDYRLKGTGRIWVINL